MGMGRFDALSERERVMVALKGHAVWLKIGITLVYAGGLSLVSELHSQGFHVFVDAKFHDIPHQVQGAVLSAARSGADLVSVHSLGGPAMLAACREGAEAARS